MKVLMIGVDRSSVGGMLTVVNNYMNDKEFVNKTNLKYIPSVIKTGKVGKILFFLFALVRIVFNIVFKRYDIVHIHMSTRTSVWREGLICKVASLLGCKVLIHIHADIEPWYNDLSPRLKNLASSIFNTADSIALLGYKWVPFMQSIVHSKNKIKVLYNAVEVPKSNLYNSNSKNIIFVGMLTPLKGINEMFEAFKKLDAKIDSCYKLHIYGPDKNGNIDRMILKFNLKDRVKYCGWLGNDGKDSVYRDALINILPSYTEALPMSILETMSYGIPNIATTVGAIPEVIKNDVNGILIKPKSSEELENAILKLLENKERLIAYSSEAYKTVCSKFSLECNLQGTFEIYKSFML